MKTAHVFDYDDTLSHTDACIILYPYHNGVPTEIHRIPGLSGIRFESLEHLPKGLKYSISTLEFVKVSRAIEEHGVDVIQSHDGIPDGHSVELDFGDVIYVDEETATPISKNVHRLEKAAAGGSDIWVVTGRSPGAEQGIQRFIEANAGVKVPLERVICVGGSGPTHKAKSQAFLTRVIPGGPYAEIHFYDDDDRNLEAVKSDVSPFARVYAINSVTDAVESDAKDRAERARRRRREGDDLRRIRQLTGSPVGRK